jgi:hypothetical protein
MQTIRDRKETNFVNAFVGALHKAEKSKFKMYLEPYQTGLASIWNE